MNYDKMLEERKKAIEKRYETDIVYKSLVDNYIKSSVLFEKNKIDNDEYVKNLNALASYENDIAHKQRLELMKYINFTVEDLTKMFEEGIFDEKTISKMLKIKFDKGE